MQVLSFFYMWSFFSDEGSEEGEREERGEIEFSTHNV